LNPLLVGTHQLTGVTKLAKSITTIRKNKKKKKLARALKWYEGAYPPPHGG
jgi:hypothetical protein